jgi:hypothetical protein
MVCEPIAVRGAWNLIVDMNVCTGDARSIVGDGDHARDASVATGPSVDRRQSTLQRVEYLPS